MKNSVFALLGGLVLVSVAQPSQSPFNVIAHNPFSSCASQQVSTDVLTEMDQPLSEWIKEGIAITIVASGADRPRFSLMPLQDLMPLQAMSKSCQSVYTEPSTL